MKKFIIVVYSFFVVAFTSLPSFSQWVKANSFTSGSLTAIDIVQSPPSIFGISSGRLVSYSSSWYPEKSLTLTDAVCLVTVGNNAIYVGSQNHGLFRSTDGGGSWTDLTANLPTRYIWTIAVSGSNVIAGTGDKGLVYSTDQGNSWKPSGGNIGYTTIRSLYVIGYDVYACVGSDVFVSHDQGANWAILPKAWDRYAAPSAVASNSKYLFLGTTAESIFRSSDKGNHWEGIGAGIGDSNAYALFASGDTLLAGTEKGVRISTDNGMTWAEPSLGTPAVKVYAFRQTGWGICAATAVGAYFSINRGIQWNAATDGLLGTNPPVSHIVASGSNLIASIPTTRPLYTFPPSVRYSTDHGNTWSKSVGMDVNDVTTFLAVGTNVYAGTDSGGVMVSSDGGATWFPRNHGLPQRTPQSSASYRTIKTLAIGSGRLFAGLEDNAPFHEDSLFFVSTDFGDSWHTVNYHNSPDSNIHIGNGVTSIITSDNDVVVRDGDGGFINSRDGGNIWHTYKYQFFYTDNPSIVFSGKTLIGIEKYHLLRSLDFGEFWWPFPKTGLLDSSFQTIISDGNNVFAGNFYGPVYLSTDAGSHWTNINDGLPVIDGGSDYDITILSAGGSYLYANVTKNEEDGIYGRPLAELGLSASPAGGSLQSSLPFLDFGNRHVGEDSSIEIDLKNPTSSNVEVSAAGIYGNGRSEFVLTNIMNIPLPLDSLPGGNSISFMVKYIGAASAHTSTAQLIVRFDADSFVIMNLFGASDGKISADVADAHHESKIEVFPNPSSGIIDIISLENPMRSLELLDALGRIVVNRSLKDERTSRIDLTSFPVGPYILQVVTNDGKTTEKILRK